MQLLVYLLAYPFLWVVSRLPFALLYAVSDGVFLILYHIIGYRKKVVRANLALVFPDKPVKERLIIEQKFYRHMCDMFLEMIKTMSIKEDQLQKRFVFKNVEVIHALEAQQKSMMVMFPHYASWEWSIALQPLIQSQGYGIYLKIQNKYFDRLVRNIRGKFGSTLINTRDTKSTVFKNRKAGQLSLYGILSDQSPQMSKAKHFAKFMEIPVPVHVGAEVLCKKLDLPAVYLRVTKLKRGHYQGSFEMLAENPSALPDYELTERFLQKVEESIKAAPEFYFWTHKRWKHKDKVPKAFL